MTIATLKNLPLLANQSQPLPSSVVDFYRNNIALGSGPNGTYLMQDFFGLPAGIPGNQALLAAISVIQKRTADGTLATLAECYTRMVNLLNGDYGPSEGGSIEIPPGPGQGTYTTEDQAMTALVAAANSAVTTAVSVMGTDAVTINIPWTQLGLVYANTPGNFAKASIDFATMQAAAQLPITAFIIGLAGYGTETQQGMSAQILESIANLATDAGQAMVAAMREGRNDEAMDSISLGHDNQVPNLPAAPPPQAALIPAQYTVSEARAEVNRRLRKF